MSTSLFALFFRKRLPPFSQNRINNPLPIRERNKQACILIACFPDCIQDFEVLCHISGTIPVDKDQPAIVVAVGANLHRRSDVKAVALQDREIPVFKHGVFYSHPFLGHFEAVTQEFIADCADAIFIAISGAVRHEVLFVGLLRRFLQRFPPVPFILWVISIAERHEELGLLEALLLQKGFKLPSVGGYKKFPLAYKCHGPIVGRVATLEPGSQARNINALLLGGCPGKNHSGSPSNPKGSNFFKNLVDAVHFFFPP